MKTSEAINELAAALAAAQGEMSNAAFNAENPAFKQGNKGTPYANLAAIRDATIPHLSKHGLALLQTTDVNTTEMLLTTRLLHSSGQWVEGVYPIPVSDRPHIMGSALTYAKRYSWAAICGVASDKDDDDGNAAQEGARNGKSLPSLPARKSSAAAKRDGDWPRFQAALRDCQSAREVERLRAEYERDVYPAWNVDWRDVATEAFAKRLAEFSGADLKQTLQDSIEPEEPIYRMDTGHQHRQELLRDQMIESIQKMGTEEDLLVWREGPEFRRDLAILPKPMQLAVRKAGATKLETLQRAGQ